MRSRLATHESIVTREGIWVGNNWLRVARDTDEKAGVLEREREISELSEQLAAQTNNVEALQQSVAAARETKRGVDIQRFEMDAGRPPNTGRQDRKHLVCQEA